MSPPQDIKSFVQEGVDAIISHQLLIDAKVRSVYGRIMSEMKPALRSSINKVMPLYDEPSEAREDTSGLTEEDEQCISRMTKAWRKESEALASIMTDKVQSLIFKVGLAEWSWWSAYIRVYMAGEGIDLAEGKKFELPDEINTGDLKSSVDTFIDLDGFPEMKTAMAEIDVPPADVIASVVNAPSPWDGKKLHDRLKYIEKKNKFGGVIHRGFSQGMTPNELKREVTDVLSAETKHKAAILARTESARVANEIADSRMMAAAENGVIEGKEALATFDDRTCLHCGSLDGVVYHFDGDPSLKDAPSYPIHPYCRCFYAPITGKITDYDDVDFTRGSKEFGEINTDYGGWLERMEEKKPGYAKRVMTKSQYDDWKGGSSISNIIKAKSVRATSKTAQGKKLLDAADEAMETMGSGSSGPQFKGVRSTQILKEMDTSEAEAFSRGYDKFKELRELDENRPVIDWVNAMKSEGLEERKAQQIAQNIIDWSEGNPTDIRKSTEIRDLLHDTAAVTDTEKGTLYRGLNWADNPLDRGGGSEKQAFLKKWSKGEKAVTNDVFGFSSEREVAARLSGGKSGSGVLLEVTDPDNNLPGIDITELSSFQTEKEHLLPAGLEFEVQDIEEVPLDDLTPEDQRSGDIITVIKAKLVRSG